MALSTIDRVREAEVKSNERLNKAESDAEQIVLEANQTAAQLIENAKQHAADFDARAAVEAQSRADEILFPPIIQNRALLWGRARKKIQKESLWN